MCYFTLNSLKFKQYCLLKNKKYNKTEINRGMIHFFQQFSSKPFQILQYVVSTPTLNIFAFEIHNYRHRFLYLVIRWREETVNSVKHGWSGIFQNSYTYEYLMVFLKTEILQTPFSSNVAYPSSHQSTYTKISFEARFSYNKHQWCT